MIFELILSFFICNTVIFYFYSIFSGFDRILKLSVAPTFKIIFGYSIFIIIIYYLYFILNLSTGLIRLFLFLTFVISIINVKNYFKEFFFSKENIFVNFILFVFLIPTIFYGEQFYIFRGNYWDSSNYLSSALLFRDYDYDKINLGLFDSIFLEFQNIQYISNARPIANYLISLILFDNVSIFFTYFFFKVLITVLIFLSFLTFLKKYINLKSKYLVIIISFAYIFSFWNIYTFEIDALSHYASIPVLILTIYLLFDIFNNLQSKKNYLIISIFTSSLFIIYPEILIIPILLFAILFFDDFRKIDLKIIYNFFWCLLIFFIITIASYETNYKHLFSQFNQSVSSNDWWGYFGSFVLGKDNLVLDQKFVFQLKNIYQESLNGSNIFSLIHNEHFQNGYKFIYLNIIPSLSGLYFLTPGKILSNYLYLFQYILLISVFLYLLIICYKNLNFFLKNKYYKKKLIFFLIFSSIILIFFLFKKSYWPIIKFYIYLSPFLFLFFAIDFKNNQINKCYIFLVSLFFLYKFSSFNHGIGRLDSFPSIIDPDLKKEILWNHTNLDQLQNCKELSFDNNNYIIKAYLNLKLLDQNINRKNKKTCKVYLKNNKFNLEYDK